MTNTRIALIGPLALIIFLAAAPPVAAQRFTTSDKDRERIVELATKLEADPLSKKARSNRKKALTMLGAAPDLRVEPCRALLGELVLAKTLGARELLVQLDISTAKYIAEHPDVAGDRERSLTGGLEGVIRTYESMRSVYPHIEIELMERILEYEARGDLAGYVREALADCDR